MRNRTDGTRPWAARLLIGLHAASILVGGLAVAALVHAATHDLLAGGALVTVVVTALVLGLVAFSARRLRVLLRRRDLEG